jgi:hypothetical protein
MLPSVVSPLLLLLLSLAGCTSGTAGDVAHVRAASPRYAFATIHYEGTPADAEYILGIRVLMQSLQPLQCPFLIMVSKSVSQSSIRLFESEGATVIPVEDVSNPFGHVLARFQNTFNKLYLWNMTEYDRVIYLDADNIAVQQDMVYDLFRCGHFCIVYMNPCHFHTGLMVVKPDRQLYSRMLQQLAEVGSYDGADQGFLSSFFDPGCWKAPLFNPANGPSEAPMNALHLAYNMHALYYFSAGREFERLKCGVSAGRSGMAVATIGYPVPIVIKPWYWWASLVGHTGPWDRVRSGLPEPELYLAVAGRLFGLLAAYVGLGFLMAHFCLRHEPAPNRLSRWALQHGPTQSAYAVGFALLLASHLLANACTPRTAPKQLGAMLYSLHLTVFYILSVRWAAWYVYQQHARPGTTLLPLTRGKWLLASLAVLWSTPIMHPALATLIGLGIHTVLIHAVGAITLVVANAMGIVGSVAKGNAAIDSSSAKR